MANQAVIPGWTGADGQASNDWNTCLLGGVILPGIVSVEDLDCGIDLDTKKAKGSDQPTSRDNGVEVAKFKIHVWMNESHWQEFQSGLPEWNPRRPGRDRQPVQIIHPIPNLVGVDNVRVVSVHMQQPSAKSGMHVVITVAEWFDKPKAQPKKKEVPVPAQTALSATRGLPMLVNDRHLDTIPEMDPTVHQLTQDEQAKLSRMTPAERAASVTRALSTKRAPDARANILESLFGK